MTFSLQKIALFLVLLTTQAYGAPEAVSTANNGLTLTAKALTAGECLDTFYSDLRGDRIFPVALSIRNNSDKTLKLNPEDIVISGAKVLTPKALESEIFSMQLATGLFTIVFFPLGFFTAYQIAKLKALEPIIKKFSIGDAPMVIQPHQTVETMLFAQVDYPKDSNGKLQSFITPNYLPITVTLKNNSFFSLQAPTVFNVHVPTI